ncbi:MAG: hypothetical protein LW875_04960 [Proteobacteria bacterium]|jgi:transcriptional regulator with XRE-family HTH domain|nr:hypothetical protein [Pseudomonadota bacterium]
MLEFSTGLRQASSMDIAKLEFVDSDGRFKSKTADRLHYEAQVQVIRKQIGSLEEVRGKLGLSQRKICQLLLVDPSAWSRWTRSSVDSAPPHIFRALQWYLTLKEKIPGLTPQYFLGKDPEVIGRQIMNKVEEKALGLQADIENLESQSVTLRNRNLDLELENQKLLKSLNETQRNLHGLSVELEALRMGQVQLVDQLHKMGSKNSVYQFFALILAIAAVVAILLI